MPKSSNKYWTAAKLKSRGWTNELIRTLLPKPRYIHSDEFPNVLRVWPKDVVMKAERDAGIQPRSAQPKRRPPDAPGPDAVAAAAALNTAWLNHIVEGSAAARLAAHYHRAIVNRLPAAAGSKFVQPAQVTSWINEFIALEKRPRTGHLPELFRNFLRAWVWCAADTEHPLYSRVCESYPAVLLACSEAVLDEFTAQQPEADVDALLSASGFPEKMLLSDGLSTVWSVWYVPTAIRSSLSLLTALNPKDEYPEARAMHRHFVLHIGGTNTGKTYAGFQRLMSAPTGVYLAPLRLLALEAQETMLDAGVDCSLLHRRGGRHTRGRHAHGRDSGKAVARAPL